MTDVRSQMEAGGTRGQEAAEVVIRETQDWKGLLRYLTDEAGELGPASRDALDQARRAMVDDASNVVRKEFPEIVIQDAGSQDFTSNIDVTFNPPDPAGLSDPAAVAQAVEQSGQAARQFMAELRRRSGGEPRVTLDTNAYSYTGRGSPLPIPANQAGAVFHIIDVTSLVEIRRGLEAGDPDGAQAAWNKFKEQAIRRASPEPAAGGEAGPMQAESEAQVKERLERQFNDAETMYDRVVAAEAEARQRLAKGEGPADEESLVARISEVTVQQRQQELVEALRQDPLDYVRVQQLQAEIKVLERGAYATRAAVTEAELEQTFQVSRLKNEIIRMAQFGEEISLDSSPRSELERAVRAIEAGSITSQDIEILLRQAVADYRVFRTAELKHMLAHPGKDGKKEVSTDRLTADNLRLQCGMGRDLSAESLQSLTIDNSLSIRIERYQINDFLPDPQHGFSIITLPGNDQYILDPTFAQFMHAERPTYTGEPLLGQDATVETAQFVRDLLRDGFIPLTPENANYYALALGASESQARAIAGSLLKNEGSMLTEIIADGQVSRFTGTPQDDVDSMDLRNWAPTPEDYFSTSEVVTNLMKEPEHLNPLLLETLSYLQERLDDLAVAHQDMPIFTTE